MNLWAGRSKWLWPWNMCMALSPTLGKHPEYSTSLNIAAGKTCSLWSVTMTRWPQMQSGTLKEERLGCVTFLPLNKLKPPSLPPLKEQGVIDYAVNLLDSGRSEV